MQDRDIVDQAIGWHLRQAEMPAAAWHDFVAWLEADTAHAAAYDRVALDDALIATLPMPRGMPIAANDAAPAAPRRRWLWAAGGSAVAAGLAVLLVPLAPASQGYAVTTAPGEQRTVTLADGTRIQLSGGTTVKLDRADTRVAELTKGEALFTVHHDAGQPFTLRSGGLSVQDVGTVFDVTRNGARLDLQVAEGAVLFQPRSEAILLKAGAGLSAREDLGSVALAKVVPAAVGGWRSGRLSFHGEPLGSVVGDVRRLSGAELVLDPGLSARPFTGMVQLTGAADRDVPHLAALIGARWRRDGERWVLSPTGSTTN